MSKEIIVLFTSHRIELLQHFEDEAKKSDVIILEEPENENLISLLEGKISVEDYVNNLDTTFPLFAKYLGEMLINLTRMSKKILQIEPYLKTLEDIYKAIESNEFEELAKNPEVEMVREIERKATGALIEYHETFLNGDFDALVEATIRFTKADAERFRVRDYMRAKKIAEIVSEEKASRILIEAGHMHILLPEHLKRMLNNTNVKITTISLTEIAARKSGIELVPNPGNELTRMYILGESVSEEMEKLLAARGLIYISLISKDEKIPTEDMPYPHLVEEVKVAKFVSKLSYDDCRAVFKKIWGREHNYFFSLR